MEEIIKIITEPIQGFLRENGLEFFARNAELLLLIIVLILIPALQRLFKWVLKVRKAAVLKSRLDPYYDYNEINSATKYYVSTKFQNVDPANELEMKYNQAFTAREKLIPFFINEVFTKKNDKKYFFILADSGMGKTTLLINLFYEYIKKFTFNKFQVRLFPLGSNNTDYDVRGIDGEVKKETILLLDAFDEDPKAIIDFRKRLSEILEMTVNYKKIVISCRTQFFSSLEDEPYETGLLKFGGNKGMHYFHKVYIAPFDDNDIKKYLSKKYTIFQYKKKTKANSIVLQCPNLMIRPMLLGYVDDLVNNTRPFQFTYQIYDELIEKWIDREASRHEVSKRQIFREQLYSFSKALALYVYLNQRARGELSIDADDVLKIAEKNNINLSELDLKSRSLLNRNSAGRVKFSHKSILEYFLSLDIYKNPEFKESFDFESMPQAQEFYLEMCNKDADLYSSNLNKDIPYSNTLHTSLREYLTEIISLKYNGGRTITILNPSSIPNNFFIGLSKAIYLNVLITSSRDIEKIKLIPGLKKICLLNECSMLKTQMKHKKTFSNTTFPEKYIEDFKKLIKEMDPDVDRKMKSNPVKYGYNYKGIDELKGTFETVNLTLFDLYSGTIIGDIRKAILKHFDDVVFVFNPLNEKGALIEQS